MWLVFDPTTSTIVERGFADNAVADEWVQQQIEDGMEAARHWIICPDVEGFNE